MISKSDRVLAYIHGLGIDHLAAMVMRSPVLSCDRNELLATVLQQMLLKDVQRFFVHQGEPACIVGVLSLSDSVRFRSGSCRACISSRLIAGEEQFAAAEVFQRKALIFMDGLDGGACCSLISHDP